MTQMEEAATTSSADEQKHLVLRLYVAGHAPNSQRAQDNLMNICREYFDGNCQVEVVDVFASPQQALDDGIVVTPTLLKVAPNPRVRIVGDLSATEKVVLTLGGRMKRK